jgi:hypothetical protein
LLEGFRSHLKLFFEVVAEARKIPVATLQSQGLKSDGCRRVELVSGPAEALVAEPLQWAEIEHNSELVLQLKTAEAGLSFHLGESPIPHGILLNRLQ